MTLTTDPDAELIAMYERRDAYWEEQAKVDGHGETETCIDVHIIGHACLKPRRLPGKIWIALTLIQQAVANGHAERAVRSGNVLTTA